MGELVVREAFCCGWRGTVGVGGGTRVGIPCLACFAKMGQFRWATVFAVKMIFSPF